MQEQQEHFLLYKPDGYLSQFSINEPKGYKKKLLNDFYKFPENCMAIGRLDEASEGLLLLTTDGKLSYHVNSNSIEKEYYAQVDGRITDKAIQILSEGGLELSNQGKKYYTLPSKAKKIKTPSLPPRQKNIRGNHHGPTSWISITLTEGKYRQVRKMTAAVGFPTLRLIRIRIAHLKINNMQPGEVLPLPDLAEQLNSI